jgi:hypothetical protein
MQLEPTENSRIELDDDDNDDDDDDNNNTLQRYDIAQNYIILLTVFQHLSHHNLKNSTFKTPQRK